MKVGFSGRPSMRAPRSAVVVQSEPLTRYVDVCNNMGLGCLEIPSALVFGKSGWRNQFLAACTGPMPQRVPAVSTSPHVEILIRTRADEVALPRSINAAAPGQSALTYLRHLVHMSGGRIVTLQFRASRGFLFEQSNASPSLGAAPLGLVVSWSDQVSITEAARAVRRSRQYMMFPMVHLDMERGQKLLRALVRALTVCHRENGGGGLYVFVSVERMDPSTTKALPQELRILMDAASEFEIGSGEEVGVIFSGQGGEVRAVQMARAVAYQRKVQEAVAVGGASSSPRVGSTVRIRDVELGMDMQYAIVPPEMASATKGMLSSESPVARAIIGQQCGARVEVSAPGGTVVYELLEVHD
ncbi:MAG: GreA/GreB family elongation factor [Clostridia bacterium]|nr:GreA/GreB family elongation factor [Clostridia bacterium]